MLTLSVACNSSMGLQASHKTCLVVPLALHQCSHNQDVVGRLWGMVDSDSHNNHAQGLADLSVVPSLHRSSQTPLVEPGALVVLVESHLRCRSKVSNAPRAMAALQEASAEDSRVLEWEASLVVCPVASLEASLAASLEQECLNSSNNNALEANSSSALEVEGVAASRTKVVLEVLADKKEEEIPSNACNNPSAAVAQEASTREASVVAKEEVVAKEVVAKENNPVTTSSSEIRTLEDQFATRAHLLLPTPMALLRGHMDRRQREINNKWQGQA